MFRLGVDWGRVVPTMPLGNNTANSTDWAALERYREIAQARNAPTSCVFLQSLCTRSAEARHARPNSPETPGPASPQMVKDRNMKVMLTLFHHSAPKWALEHGGWVPTITHPPTYPNTTSDLDLTEPAKTCTSPCLCLRSCAARRRPQFRKKFLLLDAAPMILFSSHAQVPLFLGDRWTRPFMVGAFRGFTEVVVQELGDLVDYWCASCAIICSEKPHETPAGTRGWRSGTRYRMRTRDCVFVLCL